MPRAKAKGRGAAAEESPDEEMPSTSSQADPPFTQTQSFTQAQKTLQNMSQDDIDKKVNDLVHFLLIMDQKKLPIKRVDINKHVLKEHSRGFNVFMEKAKAQLEDVFGIRLEEVDGKQKSYILINVLEIDSEEHHLKWSSEDNSRMGLVMVILSLIFMNGNVMPESLLYHTLKKLGVEPEHQHPVFGDVKRLITGDFVRQGYIELIRVPNSDPAEYEFRWGARAEKETSKRNVLSFVSDIYGDILPEQWTSQYQDVLRSEGVPNEEPTANGDP